MRPFSPAELLILQENSLDSDSDLALLTCRTVDQIRKQRAAMGLPCGRQVDDLRKAAEKQGVTK
jgi:hypothetical protein